MKKHGGYFGKAGEAHNSAWFAKSKKTRRAAAKRAKAARKKNR